jgi:uncharacterized membrane protein YfcA
MLFAGTVLAGLTAYRHRAAIDAKTLKWSLAGLAVGTVVGAATLRGLSGPSLPNTGFR